MPTLDRLTETLQWLWPLLVAIADVAVAAGCTVHIALRKRDVRAAIAWAGLVWLAPILAALVYFGLGVNRIQRRASEIYTKDVEAISELVLTPEELQLHDDFVASYPTLLAGLCRPPADRNLRSSRNQITPLRDRDEAIPGDVGSDPLGSEISDDLS